MKTVFDNDMVAHVWAQQTQANGRNAGNTLLFERGSLYSYGYHFEVARFIWPASDRAVYINPSEYSATTGRHKSLAYGAVADCRIFVLPRDLWIDETDGAELVDSKHSRAAAYYADKVAEFIGKAARARKYRALHLREARRVSAEAQDYAGYFNLPIGQFSPSVPLEQDSAELDAIAATERRVSREAAKREREASAEQLGKWRAGQSVAFPMAHQPSDGAALLRVVGEEVQTSRGARFPLAHAERALPIVARCLASLDNHGGGATFGGGVLRLGHFKVDRIDDSGTLFAGCHRIKRAELERFIGELSAVSV